MFRNRKIKALFPIIVLVLVAAIVVGAVIAIPLDTPATEPTTTYGNQYNGGVVSPDGSMLYFVNGKGILYCLSSPNSYRIDEKADSLFPYGSGLVYRRENGEVYYSNYNGEEKRLLFSGAVDLAVSGNWAFFTREDGVLRKFSLLNSKEVSLGLKVKQFLVASNAVLYTDPDGYLHTARTDGTKVEKFFAEKVDSFMRYDAYIFYKRDGMLYSVASGNAASKGTYFPVEDFNITDDGVLVFTDEKGLHTYNLKDEKPQVRDVEVQGGTAHQISVWDKYILYYNDNEQLIRCLKDGSEWVYM